MGSCASFDLCDDLEEEMRTLTMVSTFVQKALNGCSCAIYEESAGLLIPAEYFVDGGLQFLTVVTRSEASNKWCTRIECEIAAIEDICTMADTDKDEFQALTMMA